MNVSVKVVVAVFFFTSKIQIEKYLKLCVFIDQNVKGALSSKAKAFAISLVKKRGIKKCRGFQKRRMIHNNNMGGLFTLNPQPQNCRKTLAGLSL